MSSSTGNVKSTLPILHLSGGEGEERQRVVDGLLAALRRMAIDVLVIRCPGRGDSQQYYPSETEMVVPGKNGEIGKVGAGDRARFDRMAELRYRYHDLVLVVDDEAGQAGNIELHGDVADDRARRFRFRVEEGTERLATDIHAWLGERIFKIPVWGCLLIGGKSRRMGRPKHLIKDHDGLTWIEHLYAKLAEVSEHVVVSGQGELPPSLDHVTRLTDIPNARGPLAGILAALRWNPRVSWLVAACDMPRVETAALRWLLDRRGPGVWGTVPCNPHSGRHEPLLAHYDPRSQLLFEQLQAENSLRPSAVCNDNRIISPTVPTDLAFSWQNCNTPDDIEQLPK